MLRHIIPLLALLLLAGALPAQLDWRSVPSLHGRTQHALAYDPDRDRIVMFGGVQSPGGFETGETWEWTGSRWLPREVSGPSPRQAAGLAWDPHRREVLLFGGGVYDWNNLWHTTYGDTWSWNGQRWQQLSPPVAPSRRMSVAMGTDPGTGDVVLFGGFESAQWPNATLSDETWTWDGSSWTLRAPATRPPASSHATIIQNPLRPHLLMLGGMAWGQWGARGDVLWEWDGSDWSRLPAPSAPFPQEIWSAAPDPIQGRVLTLENWDNRSPIRMWSFDGQAWSEIVPTSTVFADWPANFGGRAKLILEPGAQRVLRYGAWVGLNQYNGDLLPQRATWAFDLGSRRWSIVDDRPWLPSGLYGVTHDANRGRTLFVGGYRRMRTWAYEDGSFRELAVTSPPHEMFSGLIACHYASGLVVLHGSPADPFTGAHDDRTWLFDGSQWTAQRYPTAPDPGAIETSTAYDPIGRRILASVRSYTRPHELWSFAPGVGWQNLGPGAVESAFTTAFDSARQHLVLYAYRAQRTWEWDGQTWTQRHPTTTSPPRQSQAQAKYVPELGGVVLVPIPGPFGATNQGVTWLWDGANWSALPAREPPSRPASIGNGIRTVFYDPERGRLVGFYGPDYNMPMYELFGPTLSVDRPYPHPGETTTFQLVEPAQARRPWFLGLSLSDDTGIPLIPSSYGVERRFPLDPDFMLTATLTQLRGTLDRAGRGAIAITIPNDPQLIGLTFHAAALTLGPMAFSSISNPLDLEVIR